jgi:hypothetical protein
MQRPDARGENGGRGGKRKRERGAGGGEKEKQKQEEEQEEQWAHGFQSSDVEREVGGVVVERYGTPANMKHFEVCLRVDIVMDMVCAQPSTPAALPPLPPLLTSPEVPRRSKQQMRRATGRFLWGRCRTARRSRSGTSWRLCDPSRSSQTLHTACSG